MADQNLISRNTASPISWHSLTLMQIQSVHSSRKLNLLGKGFLRDHSKQEKKSDSVTDRPLEVSTEVELALHHSYIGGVGSEGE